MAKKDKRTKLTPEQAERLQRTHSIDPAPDSGAAPVKDLGSGLDPTPSRTTHTAKKRPAPDGLSVENKKPDADDDLNRVAPDVDKTKPLPPIKTPTGGLTPTRVGDDDGKGGLDQSGRTRLSHGDGDDTIGGIPPSAGSTAPAPRVRRQTASDLPPDSILAWRDHRGTAIHQSVKEGLGLWGLEVTDDHPHYMHYLDYYHRQTQGGFAIAEIPADTSELETRDAFVDYGRWIWRCDDCGSAMLAERPHHHPREDGLSMCVTCPAPERAWVRVVFPANHADIETELLLMPGQHRSNAPLREWQPGWTIADLQDRRARATAHVEAGTFDRRSLSIGAPRTFATGEILLATSMNTGLSDPIRDLSGDNGQIEFRDNLEVGGDHHIYLEPRSTAPAREGGISYSDTHKQLALNNGSSMGEFGLVHTPLGAGATGDIAVRDTTAEGGWRLIGNGAAGQVLTARGPGMLPHWV